MAEITIPKSEFPNLQDCKVGDTYTLIGTATAVTGDELTLDVTAAEPATEPEGPAEEAPAPSNPVKKIGMPRTVGY